MAYAVKLAVFEGPLDLLLQLVSKERVDVSEVSISTITDEFMAAVGRLEEMSLEEASGFLVLAATLLELKTAKLLPRDDTIDPEVEWLLEERDRLLHRLIEYASFKGAADRVAGLMAEGADAYVRTAPLTDELKAVEPELELSLNELLEGAREALAPRGAPAVDVSHLTPIRIDVPEMVARVREAFRSGAPIAFRDLVGPAASRMEVVIAFLAVLELFKGQALEAHQDEPFGELTLRPRRPIAGGVRREPR